MRPVRTVLSPEEMPKKWYNILPDLPEPLAPPLHPATKKPVTPADLEPIFPKGLIAQEMSPERYVDIPDEALVVSVHACGVLTDRVLDCAIAARARVAVLPCCHSLNRCDTGNLEGWMDGPLAVDATRAARLLSEGYTIRTKTIPSDITPMNRLLIGWP